MTNEEVIVKQAEAYFTLQEAYKEEQKESEKYRNWWLEEAAKILDLQNELDEIKGAQVEVEEVKPDEELYPDGKDFEETNKAIKVKKDEE